MATKVVSTMTEGVLLDTDKASKVPTAQSAADENKVVQLDATGSVPSAYLPMDLLSTKLLPGSGTTVEFTTEFDNSMYTSYQFIFMNLSTGTDGDTLILRTSTDAGSTWDSGASDYKWCSVGRLSSGASSHGQDNADDSIQLTASLWGSAAIEDVCAQLSLYNAGAADASQVTFQVTYSDSSASAYQAVNNGGGKRQSGEDVTGIQFSATGTLTGTVKMYGWK